MKIFDVIIAWGNYFTEWVLYVAKCIKAVLGSISHLRDHWPARPVIPKPNASRDDQKSPEPGRPVPANGEVLDGGVSL